MRTLTAPMRAAANADGSSPYCLLKISFPSPVGDRWYAQEDFGAGDGSSWDNAQGRVLEWGVVRVEIKPDKAVNVVGDCTIRLRDEDRVLWNYFQQVEPQRSAVTIYTQFRGLSQSDMVQVHAGIINAPCLWSEKDHSVSLDVTDISTYFNHTVGHLADRLTYPNVVQTDENKMIPLVFGSVKRAPAVALDFGPITSLARKAGYYDMGLFVTDAEKFPQEIPTQIWISGERISGKFIGNFFSVSARGGALYTGATTGLGADPQHLVDTGLSGADGWCVGLYIQATTPDGRTQRQMITGYDASTHILGFGMMSGYWYTDPFQAGAKPQWIGSPFTLNSGAPNYANSTYALPVGTDYQIVTQVETHSAGEKVYLARAKYTYVVNDAPSKAVYCVEGYGHPIIDVNWSANGPVSSYAPTEWYCVLNPCLYTINRNDTTICPGRAVTSISFLLPPSQLDGRLKDDDLWVTLDGVETAGDGSGALISNPADVIQSIHTRFMGMASGNIDADSFAAAKTATAPLAMAFALREQKNGLELCADLAFQARCSEVFFAGRAQLIYLTNVMVPSGAPPSTGRARYLGSLDIGRREWNQVVTEVSASYIDNALRQTIILRSAAAEAFVGGRRAKTIDFWAYATLPPVQGVARFWLNRWQYIWQQIALVESLRRLDAEPYDIFDLDLPGWFGAGQASRIIGIEQTLGGGSGRRVPGIRLSAEIPYFPAGACDTLAEAMPPPGCWACETTCQIGCELFCTTAFMLGTVQGDTPGATTEPTAAPTAEPTAAPTTPAPTTAAPPAAAFLVSGAGNSYVNGYYYFQGVYGNGMFVYLNADASWMLYRHSDGRWGFATGTNFYTGYAGGTGLYYYSTDASSPTPAGLTYTNSGAGMPPAPTVTAA